MSKSDAVAGKLPHQFIWGFATASFQIEGSTNVDDRGKSIWDDFCKQPGKTLDGRDGDVATDSYRLWKEDVALLAQYGVKSYRFSISWSRIIPLGGRNDPVNPKGIEWYSDFIDALLENGIIPFVTLYHWDLPQALHDRYGGWLNKDEIIQDYVRYARVCFEAFGNRVKHWLTMNEPWCIAILGYGRGIFAPGRSSDRSRSLAGDSTTEPWIVGHNVILAHAYAIKVYREEFRPMQKGEIGITLNGDWTIPYDDCPESTHMSLVLSFADKLMYVLQDPIYLGHYPGYLKQIHGDRLPDFTTEELAVVKGSSDYYGMNAYTTKLCRAGGNDEFQGFVEHTFIRPDGTQLGTQAHCAWLQDCGLLIDKDGKRTLMIFCFVTENGFAVKDESSKPIEAALQDHDRVNYFKGATASLKAAVLEDRVDVRAYFTWIDELSATETSTVHRADGYLTRFGVTYVDCTTQKRYPKESAKFLVQVRTYVSCPIHLLIAYSGSGRTVILGPLGQKPPGRIQ
ncbi:glycoside hydrolase family 1 protein [Boletus reticuloceps]|uniref:Glycoside hydrolase family 1 protein n=1 Tax=Boletus reticuloceps TaxID=495285 RepID=A0A8I3AEK7_9AGAM|nr:glycoside hydrolase family 1 protein [Boletus reticuloceps]